MKLFSGTGTLFRKCLRSERCRGEYLAAVRRTADRFERLNLVAMMDRLMTVIGPAAAADPRKPYTDEEMAAAPGCGS